MRIRGPALAAVIAVALLHGCSGGRPEGQQRAATAANTSQNSSSPNQSPPFAEVTDAWGTPAYTGPVAEFVSRLGQRTSPAAVRAWAVGALARCSSNTPAGRPPDANIPKEEWPPFVNGLESEDPRVTAVCPRSGPDLSHVAIMWTSEQFLFYGLCVGSAEYRLRPWPWTLETNSFFALRSSDGVYVVFYTNLWPVRYFKDGAVDFMSTLSRKVSPEVVRAWATAQLAQQATNATVGASGKVALGREEWPSFVSGLDRSEPWV